MPRPDEKVSSRRSSRSLWQRANGGSPQFSSHSSCLQSRSFWAARLPRRSFTPCFSATQKGFCESIAASVSGGSLSDSASFDKDGYGSVLLRAPGLLQDESCGSTLSFAELHSFRTPHLRNAGSAFGETGAVDARQSETILGSSSKNGSCGKVSRI